MNKSAEYLNTTVNTVTSNLDETMGWLNDPTITNVILLGLIVYSALFIGKVWPKGMDFFKHPVVKIIAFALIAYISTKNVGLALVATIVVISIMMTNLKNTKEFLTTVPSNRLTTDDDVYEAIMGRCMCRCNGRQCNCNCGQPENVDIDEIMVISEEQLPQVGTQKTHHPTLSPHEDISDSIKEINDDALNKIKQQFIDHDSEINRNKITNYTKGCGASPYKNRSTPFGSPNFLDAKFARTTMDAEYDGYLNE